MELIISHCFTNLHSKLQAIEKRLKAVINENKTKKNAKLFKIKNDVLNSIESLQALLTTARSISNGNQVKKVNLRKLMDTLRNAVNSPCYLIDKNEDVNFCFISNDLFNKMEDYFNFDIKENPLNFKLVSTIDFPDDEINFGNMTLKRDRTSSLCK